MDIHDLNRLVLTSSWVSPFPPFLWRSPPFRMFPCRRQRDRAARISTGWVDHATDEAVTVIFDQVEEVLLDVWFPRGWTPYRTITTFPCNIWRLFRYFLIRLRHSHLSLYQRLFVRRLCLHASEDASLESGHLAFILDVDVDYWHYSWRMQL